MNPDCKDCQKLDTLTPVILRPDNWQVYLPKNQAWLGRVCIHLRNHKQSLAELTDTEWSEFQDLVRWLEPVYKQAFGAMLLNWACNMNNAFRQDPAYPHVHWHVFPRYKETPIFNGIEFPDALYGRHIDPNAKHLVDEETLAQIAARLKGALEE